MRAALILLLWLCASAAHAQGAASLVADSVRVDRGALIAEGNVEVFYDGARLSAAAIVYDREADRLAITGPIFIQSPNGDIITAERASLDPKLENGILRGARLVLDRQLQLAANRIDRREGRYTQLTRTAATSCQVCGDGPPLWEIRARRIIHDQDERQLYFENATLRIGGLPVAWIPAMRLPDPTLERATGLLVPNLRSTQRLGLGIKLPYFIALSPYRDLTLTPYLSPQTRTLETRYRQAFLRGDLTVESALTRDTIRKGENRAYLFANADVRPAGDWQLSAQLRLTSDDAYLLDYGYSDTDRLDSYLRATRIRESSRLSYGVTVVESLRDGDDNDLLPSVIPSAQYETVLTFAGLPGQVTLEASADAAIRLSDADTLGRDTARIGASAEWAAGRVLPHGLLARARAGLTLDAYAIGNDSTFGSTAFRALPYLSTELRWPLARAGALGGRHTIEPVLSLAWSDARGDAVPNEDSSVTELDEANLLALTRFPGEDAVETGLRGAAALTYGYLGPRGWDSTVTVGRLFRQDPLGGFAPESGLGGTASDWLVSFGFGTPDGLSLNARGLMDDAGDFSRAEGRLGWQNARVDLAATYILLSESPEEGRTDPVTEWTLDGSYRVNDAWTLSGEARYDLAADEPQSAALGVEYRNECVTVGLSVSRRFTSSTTLEPETDYGLRVGLNGFSAGRSAAPRTRQCRD